MMPVIPGTQQIVPGGRSQRGAPTTYWRVVPEESSSVHTFGVLADGESLEILRRFEPGDFPAIRKELRSYFTRELGFDDIVNIDTTDGLRLYFANGDIAHIRPSGNAPQLRIYAVANTEARAEAIVKHALSEPNGILRRLS